MAVDLGAYLNGLIGRPWERRGVHCWALVQQVQRDLFGREVPLGPLAVPARGKRRELFSINAEAVGWREVAAPVHGAVARMSRVGGNPADLEHAGVYLALDGGRVLHTDHPHGVVLDSLLELQKVRGWLPRWFVPLTD
ncbi:glycoside hydrolase [Microvirga sp. GCM10011540]|uniref:glycoside hydrolase n=1 Tax=Microvirga sp. GCM10011540 TaxID=3317338 RepID=UPI00361ADEE1